MTDNEKLIKIAEHLAVIGNCVAYLGEPNSFEEEQGLQTYSLMNELVTELRKVDESPVCKHRNTHGYLYSDGTKFERCSECKEVLVVQQAQKEEDAEDVKAIYDALSDFTERDAIARDAVRRLVARVKDLEEKNRKATEEFAQEVLRLQNKLNTQYKNTYYNL